MNFAHVDDPSQRLHDGPLGTFPNLRVVALDPTHLPIVYEYATWRKRTEGSRLLRCIMAKFSKIDAGVSANAWGPIFKGADARPLDRQEELSRDKILNCSMAHARAQLVVKALQNDAPFFTRVDFIEGLAALASPHRDEVQKKVTGSNKPLYKVLWSAAAPARIEWYLNATRVRHSMHQGKVSLLPSGTTSNEALHAEINGWFRQTQQIHQATLTLKLNAMTLGKLISHNSAMYRHTARQMSSASVLARAVSKSLWQTASWRRWCRSLSSGGATRKAALPLQSQRQEAAERVRSWVRKKPAAAVSRAPRCVKRTAFTLQRLGQFRKGGVKGTVFRRPARGAP